TAEARHETLHATPPEPAHRQRGDLVGDRITKHGWMAPALPGVLADHPSDLRFAATVVQIADVSLAPKTNQHAQAVTLRLIEQPHWRRRVRAHRVHIAGPHHLEIVGDDCACRELVTLEIGVESAIG